jgi:hypothetical protein
VTYDADAVLELEELKGRDLRKAVFTAVDKLRRLGPSLAPPHVSTLKGEEGLMELRPRQGRTHVRPIFGRFRDSFVILAFSVCPDKKDFEKAVASAHARRRRYEP